MNSIVSFLFCVLSSSLLAQQLVINEISQGSGSNEYVEFVVMGSPNCSANPPCIDLRGVVIDDNNGEFAAGSSTGIANGALRFSQNGMWSCVPQGTIILIYSNSSPNPLVPANDNNLNDGNCLLVLPANSNLLEGQTTSPLPNNPSYPGNASWIVGGGTWNSVSMNNANDAFQIRSSISAANSSHAITWGNNSGGAAHFASANGAVFSMMNSTDNNPFNNTNWIQGAITTNETPGAPNSIENAAWIANMNPNCSSIGGLTVTITAYPSTCGATCQGAASASISGGLGPYQISWSNGASTDSVSNLCAGTVSIQVTDALGCTATSSATIIQQNSQTSTALYSNESCENTCDGSAFLSSSGGTGPYSYYWSNGTVGSNDENLCPGTYSIVSFDQNNCTDTISFTIEAGNPFPTATVSDFGSHYTTDPVVTLNGSPSGGIYSSPTCSTCINGNTFDPSNSGAGVFQICYTVTQNNCSDSACSFITIIDPCPTYPGTNTYYSLCLSDSIFVDGNWYTGPTEVIEMVDQGNGCFSTITHHISACIDSTVMIEIPNIFTPNNDQLNDLFEMKLVGLTSWNATIFNRWGSEIGWMDATVPFWDGKVDGLPATDGIYFYQLSYQTLLNESGTKTGFFHLIR